MENILFKKDVFFRAFKTKIYGGSVDITTQ